MMQRLAGAYERHGEKVRFLVVGVWNTLFSLGVLWLLDRLIPYDQGSLLQKQGILFASWVVSVTQNFFTFKFLVFRSKGHWLKEYVRMYVTYAVTFVVQSVMTLAISEIFDLRVFWANLPTIVVVAILSYFGHKYFTFRSPVQIASETDISTVFSGDDETARRLAASADSAIATSDKSNGWS